ncbi:hypothetical protein ACQEVB_16995 [Pseudonocardia sp. CA-107938]|uniref:hypothetical protein n=1 Tax=Pseudonocardia sp. CA-107938 TaxID=3240021 RepID=UPI003D8B34F3
MHTASVGDSAARLEPVAGRRVVAVVVSATELLRPRSDLARILESFDESDVLFVADEDRHGGGVVALPVAGVDQAVTELADLDDTFDDDLGDDDPDDDDQDDDVDPGEELDRAVAALGLPDVRAHRLGLPPTFGGEAEPDIVAALSELVGFDPEPGVYCLAPATVGGDSAGSTVTRAARRIAQVYGLPLLSYRCLELAVVDGERADRR